MTKRSGGTSAHASNFLNTEHTILVSKCRPLIQRLAGSVFLSMCRRRLVNNEFMFCMRDSRLFRSARYPMALKTMRQRRSIPNGNTKKISRVVPFRRRRRTWSFHVVVLQRTTKNCVKIYNARALLLFCWSNLLFGDVLVAVIVVVCLSSLMFCGGRLRNLQRFILHVHSHCFAH